MSKNSINIGTFVRMIDGTLGEIVECPKILENSEYSNELWMKSLNGIEVIQKKLIYKKGNCIFDLIKKKDILLGYDGKLYQCLKKYQGYIFTTSKNKYNQTITLVDYQIKKILPYELFNDYSYNVTE